MKIIGGPHLILDGKVKDTLEVHNVLPMFDDLVESLGMVYLTKPLVANVDLDISKLDTEEDEGGFSIFAQITTSHIALHVWPVRGTFCMDIFSCKPFDYNMAGKLIWDYLGVLSANVWVVNRNGDKEESAVSTSICMSNIWSDVLV